MPLDTPHVMKYYLRATYPCAAGLLTSMGNAPVSWPALTLIGVGIVVYLFSKAKGVVPSFMVGVLFGTGYYLATLSWLVFPFLVEPAKNGWMAPFALIVTAVGLSLLWGLVFGVPALLKDELRYKYFFLGLSWIAVELLREHLFTGFPWGMFAYTLDGTPIIQITSIIGANGLTGLIIFLTILPFVWKNFGQGALISITVLVAIWFWGWQRVPPKMHFEPSGGIVRIIQPNIPQKDKWEPLKQSENFNLLLDLSNSAGKNNASLIIWPETAVTVFVDEKDMSNISARIGHRPLVAGYRRYNDNRMYNSLMSLDAKGSLEQIYDKQHLVPFGEFIPFEGFLKWILVSGLANDEIWDFSEGTGMSFLDLPVLGTVRALICYEAIFPHEVRTDRRPDILLQITNDAWIGNSWGPKQHFVMAKTRSTELGLPLVRVSNNGISAVIDGYGRIVSKLDVGTRGVLDSQIPASQPATFYSKAGDWPLRFLLFLSGAFLFIRSKIITNIS